MRLGQRNRKGIGYRKRLRCSDVACCECNDLIHGFDNLQTQFDQFRSHIALQFTLIHHIRYGELIRQSEAGFQ